MLTGKILITGGAGFLGRAIIQRATAEGWPCEFTVYSRDETKQWELKHRFPQVRCVLGSVTHDLPRLIAVCTGHDVVIHAAAVKYIPEAEHNVLEAIEVNVEGSRNVALAAIAAGVDRVIGVSTDKACAPANLYGATKMVMERMFGEANRMGRTRFVCVRYGNVVGSTGSVIPLFLKQLDEHGRVSITDPRMSRFWLSPDAAIDLILWALDCAHEWPGRTFIGACPSMYIAELAQAVYEVWAMAHAPAPSVRVPVVVTGHRPGEKMHEALFDAQEASRVQLVHGRELYRAGGEQEGYVMLPATEVGRVPRAEAYTSDKPLRFLEPTEMAEMIQEAALI